MLICHRGEVSPTCLMSLKVENPDSPLAAIVSFVLHWQKPE